jgi:predicted nucleotidyltransferase
MNQLNNYIPNNPDKETVNQIIHELMIELKNKYPDFKGIYFFGSRARGKYHEDSDIDLALVFDRVIDWKFKDEIISVIYGYELKYDTFIDSFTYNYQEILNPVTPFKQNVKCEGIFYG